MHTGDHRPGKDGTAIIVSGMHRSGTSAVTRVISLLGAALPEELIEGRGDNERGFWEGRAVVDLDDRILDRFGAWWGGWESIDAQQLRNLTRLVERARRFVREDFQGENLIVLKDPRLSRLLPLWTLALEKEGFNCVHVVAVRRPGAVADSLGRRNGLSPKASALSWLAHSLDAEFHTRSQPRVFVSFENILRDWRSETDRISRTLGVQWPTASEDVTNVVAAFIEPSLVHKPHPSTLKGPITAIDPVYDVLRRWSEDAHQHDDLDVLDSWRMLLEPVRSERSGVALVSRERQEVLADLETRNQPAGALGSNRVWAPIRYEGHNVEAAGAWAWLMRERQHCRRVTRLQVSPAERERSVGILPKVRRWRRGRLPLSRPAARMIPSRRKWGRSHESG